MGNILQTLLHWVWLLICYPEVCSYICSYLPEVCSCITCSWSLGEDCCGSSCVFIIDLVLFVIACFMSLKVDILHFLYVLAHWYQVIRKDAFTIWCLEDIRPDFLVPYWVPKECSQTWQQSSAVFIISFVLFWHIHKELLLSAKLFHVFLYILLCLYWLDIWNMGSENLSPQKCRIQNSVALKQAHFSLPPFFSQIVALLPRYSHK